MESSEKALFQLIVVIGIISVVTLVLTILYMQGFIATKTDLQSQHNENLLMGLLNHTEQVEKGSFNTTEIALDQNNSQMLKQILNILTNGK